MEFLAINSYGLLGSNGHISYICSSRKETWLPMGSEIYSRDSFWNEIEHYGTRCEFLICPLRCQFLFLLDWLHFLLFNYITFLISNLIYFKLENLLSLCKARLNYCELQWGSRWLEVSQNSRKRSVNVNSVFSILALLSCWQHQRGETSKKQLWKQETKHWELKWINSTGF